MQWDDDDYAPRMIAHHRRHTVSYGARHSAAATDRQQCSALQAAFANDKVLRHRSAAMQRDLYYQPQQLPPSASTINNQSSSAQSVRTRGSVSYRRARLPLPERDSNERQQTTTAASLVSATSLQHGGSSVTRSVESANSSVNDTSTNTSTNNNYALTADCTNAAAAGAAPRIQHRWSPSVCRDDARIGRLLRSTVVPRPAQQSVVSVDSLQVGLADTVGRRPSMEDEIIVARHRTPDGTHFCLFAVCDGHGGDRVSQFVAKRWPALLFGFLDQSVSTTRSTDDEKLRYALRESVAACNDRIHADLLRSPQARLDIGTTLCALLVVDRCRLYTINVGDSRALGVTPNGGLWRSAALTLDHRPGRLDERQRIDALGGFVLNHDGVDRVMGNLAVSRALGDFHLTPYVSGEPTITGALTLDADVAALVLCCDGVTDVLSDEQIAALVGAACAQANAEAGAATVRNAAFQAGSGDNISVVVIDLTAQCA